MTHSQLLCITKKEGLCAVELENILSELLKNSDNTTNWYILILCNPQDMTIPILLQELEGIYNVAQNVKMKLSKLEIGITVLLLDDKFVNSGLYDTIKHTSNVHVDTIPANYKKDVKQITELKTNETSNIRSEEEKIKLVRSESLYSAIPVVAVGGTFDHLHEGHKILLTVSAFLTKDLLIVGVTGSELLKNKKYLEYMETYEYRAKNVENFLRMIKPDLNLKICEINDVCGPTAQIEEIDALVVSLESLKGSDYVNQVRSEKGWKKLDIYKIGVLGSTESTTFQNKLSSTDYRKLEFLKHKGETAL